MRWLPVVLMLASCETGEVRAWSARRVELARHLEELGQLEQQAPSDRASALRTALDLPGFVRSHAVAARVFTDTAGTRLTASGTVQECREAVATLAEVRWLTQHWRLRLEHGHCEWEARTGKDFAALEQALSAPAPRWTAPPSELLSSGVDELKKTVRSLEAEVQQKEAKLGVRALLEGRLAGVQPLVDSLRAQPAPCDLAVLDRELALDPGERGKLLEVEQARLIHPLEPRTDFRLRGLVQVQDGALAWRCEAL